MNIFVGNLNTATTEEQLQLLFTTYGRVNSVKIIKDFETDISRGYGFVEMDDNEEGNIAIRRLNKSNFMMNDLDISQAIPRPTPQNSITQASRDSGGARNNSMKRKR